MRFVDLTNKLNRNKCVFNLFLQIIKKAALTCNDINIQPKITYCNVSVMKVEVKIYPLYGS